MNLLFTYILAAMISWVPLNEGGLCYWPVSQSCLDRANQHYQEIAKDVAEVVYEPNTKLPFDGADAKAKTALLMVSIASTESHFNKDVDDCRRTGDHGIAFGLWQTHTPRAATCNDRKQALRLAIGIVVQSFEACKDYPLIDRMAVYTSGSCHVNWRPSHIKMYRAFNYLKDHPVTDTLEDSLNQ